MNQPWVYNCSPSWTPFLPPSPSYPSGSKSLHLLWACWLFLSMLWDMWDLSSPTRDWTHAPCLGRRSLNHRTARELPETFFFFYVDLCLLFKSPFNCIWGKRLWNTDVIVKEALPVLRQERTAQPVLYVSLLHLAGTPADSLPSGCPSSHGAGLFSCPANCALCRSGESMGGRLCGAP